MSDRPHYHRGFTLVEMLVSVVLTTLICLMVADIASRSVETVGTASGKMTATEKLARLHQLLANDFAALPLLEDRPSLSARSDGAGWMLTLQLPVKRRDAQAPVGQSAWRRVVYRWDSAQNALTRQDYLEGTSPVDPIPVITGVMTWEPEFLDASDFTRTGTAEWSAQSLPVLLRLQTRFSGVWEEGTREELHSATGQGRVYSLSLPVGAR